MAFDDSSLRNYVDVAERLTEFFTKYPDGSCEPRNPDKPYKIKTLNGTDKHGKQFTATFIVYTAAAYRTPEDPRPGIGVAWEVFPGRTPYTLGSELMNAETSAWGRALAALGIATRKGIATQQDVQRARENGATHNGHPGEDPWAGQPAGELPPADAPEDQPGNVNRKQLANIHRLLGKLDLKDRDRGLAAIEDIIKGPLDGPNVAADGTHRTTSNLSYQEGQQVIAALKEREAVEAARAAQDAAAEAGDPS